MNLVREGRGVGRHHCQQIKTEVLQIGFPPHSPHRHQLLSLLSNKTAWLKSKVQAITQGCGGRVVKWGVLVGHHHHPQIKIVSGNIFRPG